MKLKAYEKFIWMIELGAIYLLELKRSFLVHPESVGLELTVAHWTLTGH